MSAEKVNWCPQTRQDKNNRTETGADGNKCDFLLPSEIKCENEQMDRTCHKLPNFDNYCCEKNSPPPVPIKREPEGEDSKPDLQLQGVNVLLNLKEEIEIEEHKPGWELVRGKGSAPRLAEGDLVVSESNFNCPSGSKSAEQVVKYNCAHCPYKTNNRQNFIPHYNHVHKQCTEVYRCHECSYTGNRFYFIKHYKRQHSNRELYKCDQCSFETRVKYNLTKHYRTKHSKDAVVYKCDECSIETKYKSVLTQHFKHKHSKEAEVYKCGECSYETTRKNNVTQHHKIKHSEEGTVYKCEECSYQTRIKSHLTQHHKIKHSKEGAVYNCDQCSYQTKYKSAIAQHFKHKHSKEANV